MWRTAQVSCLGKLDIYRLQKQELIRACLMLRCFWCYCDVDSCIVSVVCIVRDLLCSLCCLVVLFALCYFGLLFGVVLCQVVVEMYRSTVALG